MRIVLIIEDDRDIRDSLQDIFEAEGYEVKTAANGQVGLEMMREIRPSLVLLDLMMPVMTGWQVLEKQQKDAQIAKIPVIVMSAAASEPHPKPSAFLRKPVSLDALLPIATRYSDPRSNAA